MIFGLAKAAIGAVASTAEDVVDGVESATNAAVDLVTGEGVKSEDLKTMARGGMSVLEIATLTGLATTVVSKVVNEGSEDI